MLANCVEKFLGLTELARIEHPDLSVESGFQDAVSFIWENWDGFLSVAQDPVFICWVGLLNDLICPHRGSLIAGNDVLCFFTSKHDQFACLKEHLEQFSIFAFATAVKTQTSFRPPKSVAVEFGWLPGIDREYLSSPIGGDEKFHVISEVSNGIPIFDGQKRNGRRVPQVGSNGGSLSVHANHPYFQLGHIERWPRLMDYQKREQFVGIVDDALSLIDELIPGLCQQSSIILKTCVPMTTEGITPMASGSYTRLNGSIFLACSPQTELVAEMFIHEFCHNKLTLLEDVSPFFPSFSRSQFRHYSPWRDSLRSAEGVLHALFVHAEIARFWICLYQYGKSSMPKDLIRRRVWTLLGQISMGAKGLEKTGEFTDTGKILLAAIVQPIDGWTENFPPCCQDALPFFSEIKADSALAGMNISQALRSHKTAIFGSTPH
ncbi:MAG: hypothetical protein IPL32_03575 [Chloracidobacterium sp.]|nr:hypothetical protein [Chloracidobacterium sp.]